MLKCGQTDNHKYTFGLRKDQMSEVVYSEEDKIIESRDQEYIGKCSHCGSVIKINNSYCSFCGAKLE